MGEKFWTLSALTGLEKFFNKAFLILLPPEYLPRPVVYTVHFS